MTLEARRQLIWITRIKGYLMAIEDLEHARDMGALELNPAILYLKSKMEKSQ
jgi:hypothetical protein